MTEAEARQKIVGIMQGWVGYVQGSDGHKHIIDTYNNHRPLARGYKMPYTAAWCAATVSAASIQAGFTDIIPTECSCSQMIEQYKKMGRWEENDAYRPSPGDLVMYYWNDGENYATTDQKNNPNHVGMVVKVVGDTITVVEGNKGNPGVVGYREIKVNGRYIRGYCLPDYASKANLTPNQKTVQNAVNDGVISAPDYWLDVLDGKKTADPKNIKALIDKYNEVFGANNASIYGADDIISMSSPDYWVKVLDGKENANAGNIKALMDKYHEKVKK